MLSYEKTGSRYEIRGTRGDAENFYKMVISNIFVLSYALTYKYELTLMVRASLGSQVGKFLRNSGQCLNVKRQVGVLLLEHRGWILRIASLIKIEKQHNPSFLLIHIVDSTFHQADCRRSDSSDGQTGSLRASFRTKRTQNICMLSLIQT